MLVHLGLCDIKDQADIPLYPRVRFIYQSNDGHGVAAVWLEDMDAHTASRLARVEGVVFERRRLATQPHILNFSDGTWWRIWPLNVGGCGSCGSRVANYSYGELLSPDLVSL